MPRTDVGAGCAMVVFGQDGRFLMLHRIGRHANGTWCLPGGWIEKFEEFEAAGAREVMEELGVRVRGVRVVGVHNHIRRDEDHHSITIIMAAIMRGGETPENAEPDKADEIRLVDDWNDMPRPTMVDYSSAVPRAVLE